jgi:hypothetical protein
MEVALTIAGILVMLGLFVLFCAIVWLVIYERMKRIDRENDHL